jgi:hypothetical protein
MTELRPRSFFLSVVLFAAACNGFEAPWTRLSGAEAAALRDTCSRPFPGGLYGEWIPRESDILIAESRLESAFDAAFARRKNGSAYPRPRYRRQYAGFYRDSQRVLYINAIAEEDAGKEWRTNAVWMCDGGIGTYGAVFDMTRGAFDFFEFNGSL